MSYPSEINYLQIVPLSWEERFKMYMKCSKKELASMLAERDKYTSPDCCKECLKDCPDTIGKSESYSASTIE